MKNIFQSIAGISMGILFSIVIIPSAFASHEGWTPYAGESDVNRESSYNRMIWNKISGFGSSATYEHETIVYTGKFAKEASGGYWSSNLPSAYKDTKCCGSINNFTVGSANAKNIKANTWYYTYYDLQPQDTTTKSSRVRINGQLGHRNPSGCYSTWCIYADSTYGLVEFTAPVGLTWRR